MALSFTNFLFKKVGEKIVNKYFWRLDFYTISNNQVVDFMMMKIVNLAILLKIKLIFGKTRVNCGI
jgi:hypothetical protein